MPFESPSDTNEYFLSAGMHACTVMAAALSNVQHFLCTHARTHGLCMGLQQPGVKTCEQTQSHRYSPRICSSRHASLTFSHCLNPNEKTLQDAHSRTHTHITEAQITPPTQTRSSLGWRTICSASVKLDTGLQCSLFSSDHCHTHLLQALSASSVV